MNRRSFLSFLSVAPVALPMAATATESLTVIGVDLASADQITVSYISHTLDGLEVRYLESRKFSINEIRREFSLKPLVTEST